MSGRQLGFELEPAVYFYRGVRKLVVTGSRTTRRCHLPLLQAEIDHLSGECVVAHGGNGYFRGDLLIGGADLLAAELATARGLEVVEYKADWKVHRTLAGPMRNQRMLDSFQPEAVLAFWDGKTDGTRGCMELARARGIPVRLVSIDLGYV